MHGYYYDLKKSELDKAKKELKVLEPNSDKYNYVKERISYLIDDLFNLEHKERAYPTTG